MFPQALYAHHRRHKYSLNLLHGSSSKFLVLGGRCCIHSTISPFAFLSELSLSDPESELELEESSGKLLVSSISEHTQVKQYPGVFAALIIPWSMAHLLVPAFHLHASLIASACVRVTVHEYSLTRWHTGSVRSAAFALDHL